MTTTKKVNWLESKLQELKSAHASLDAYYWGEFSPDVSLGDELKRDVKKIEKELRGVVNFNKITA